jgi:hypothetical protein
MLFGMPPWDWNHYSWHDINWGDVPTALALIFALIAGYIGFQIYKIESERDQQAALERRRAQAAKIAIWIEEIHDEKHTDALGEAVPVPTYWRLTLRNGSDLPVSDVFYGLKCAPEMVGRPELSLLVRGMNILPPGDETVRLEREEITSLLNDRLPKEELQPFENPEDLSYSVFLRFRDSAGVDWRRPDDGSLVEVTSGRPKRDDEPFHRG